VNESFYKFAVNQAGAVRFGMGAIKGVGRGAVETIVAQRKENGPYRSVFDLAKRIDLRAANKKAFENLALAGGFDSFGGVHRAQYFHPLGDAGTFLEKVIRYGARFQENENSAQVSLFGESSDIQIPEPEVPPCPEWGTMEKLKQEKEVVGIYISGHPLDDYKTEINTYTNANVSFFNDLPSYVNRELAFAGVVSEVQHRISKNGKGWAAFTVEDYADSYEFRIFGEDYLKYRHFLIVNSFIFCKALVKEGWTNKETGKQGEPRLQYNGFYMLQEILESFTKKLTLKLRVDHLEEDQISGIKEIIQSHPGDLPLHFSLYEMEDSIKVDFVSRSQKIGVNTALLEALEAADVHFSLN
jgi:DNA polymerase-3 subunit alpha